LITRRLAVWCLTLAACFVADRAMAKCLPIAQAAPRIQLAALPAAGSVRLTYPGHSSFLIETAAGARAVTDFNDFVAVPVLPDIVTMNNAHETHFSVAVDPKIKHTLKGWDDGDRAARHDLFFRDLRVWNVPTNASSLGIDIAGNSIFVFEAAGLCIAHLGHLHQLLSDDQLIALGKIHVLLVPVDGAYTMSQELMVQVIGQIAAPLVVPMHYFSDVNLTRFQRLIDRQYQASFAGSATVTLSRFSLPNRRVLVMPGG